MGVFAMSIGICTLGPPATAGCRMFTGMLIDVGAVEMVAFSKPSSTVPLGAGWTPITGILPAVLPPMEAS
uniref:Putative secreted protein n=1 Tax=Anopheles marajoara TaxID=58244 RepID=A0A2M4CEL7_9DIPT